MLKEAGWRALVVAGLISGTAFEPGCNPLPKPLQEKLQEVFNPEGSKVYGKLLDRQESGMLVIAENPTPVELMYIPQKGEKYIHFRREVSTERTTTIPIEPSMIQARHGVRVFGRQYTSERDYLGQLGLVHEGQAYLGGLWIAITDEGGSFIDPYGIKLRDGEKPYYVAGNFATVVPKEPESQLTYEDIIKLKASHYFDGSVAISKEVNARTEPRITSQHPAEINVVPWNKILKINGIDVQKLSRFTIIKPLVAPEGDDPSLYKTFSKWLVVLAEVMETRNNRETVQTIPLYINMSAATEGYVVLDRPLSSLSDRNFIPVGRGETNLIPKDLAVVGK